MCSLESKVAGDVAMISGISRGDEDAFLSLYNRFSGPLYSLLLKMLHSKHDAEEVLQTVFLHVWNAAGSYQAGRFTVFTWLVLVTRRSAIDRLRQRQWQGRAVGAATLEAKGQDSLDDDEHDGAILHENQAAARAAFDRIPAEQRQAIEMAFFKGMSLAEISEALAEPLGTIRERIRGGMLRLRESAVCRWLAGKSWD